MSVESIKKLRVRSGASVSDCRLALDQAASDFDRAEQILHEIGIGRLQTTLGVDAESAAELFSRYGWDFEKARLYCVDWKAAASARRAQALAEAARPPVERARHALRRVDSYYDLVERGVLLESGRGGDGSWPEQSLPEAQETLQWLGLLWLLIFTDHAQWFWDDGECQEKMLAALDGAGWSDHARLLREALESSRDGVAQESRFDALTRHLEEDRVLARLVNWIVAHAHELPAFTGVPEVE